MMVEVGCENFGGLICLGVLFIFGFYFMFYLLLILKIVYFDFEFYIREDWFNLLE